MILETVDISDISQDPANVRKPSDRNLEAIAASLRAFGQQKPIVVDKRGVILAGNGTYEAAKRIGWDKIQITRTDLSGTMATAYAIADNRTAELAEWDDTALVEQLRSLQSEEFDLANVGYTDDEVQQLIDGIGNEILGASEVTEDEIPEPPIEPITKPGDLWLLGEHRLLCGDSTKAEDVQRLMNGEKADLCLTDPPYGLGDSNSNKNNYDLYDDSKENLIQTIKLFFPIVSKLTDVIVLTPGIKNHLEYPKSSWTMAWFTPAGTGLGPWGFCCWQPILCYGKDPKLTKGLGSFPDAIVHTETSEKNGHPCAKPINFWKWLMERTSEINQTVCDPFLGSGTTLIAAEQLGRKCYGMEISPQYCDVIVKRWETLTGRVATRA